MKIRIKNIEWDTDDETPDIPETVMLDAKAEGLEDIAEEGADWLSDRFGWCVKGFSFEEVPSSERKVFAMEMTGVPQDLLSIAMNLAVKTVKERLAAEQGEDFLLDIRDASAEVEFMGKVARLDTSQDKLIREAVQDYGLETLDDIKDHLHSGQLDGDWYSSQSDALDALIVEARKNVGIGPFDEDGAILNHPEVKALEVEDELDGPGM